MKKSSSVLPILMTLLAVISAAVIPEEEDVFVNHVVKDALFFLNACGGKEITVCLKEKALRYIDLLPQTFEIGSIIKVKRSTEKNRLNYSEPVANEYKGSTTKENLIDDLLLKRIVEFFTSHTIEFKLPKEALIDIDRSLEEGRKKKKKGGGSGIILLFCLKMAALAALTLKILALLSFKALIMGKIALTISGIIALKKLLDSKHHSTYEVIAHPHYEDHGRSDRSIAQELAYGGQNAIKSASEGYA